MTQRRGFKRALSFACALCLMFSMLGSGSLAAIAEELGNGELEAAYAELEAAGVESAEPEAQNPELAVAAEETAAEPADEDAELDEGIELADAGGVEAHDDALDQPADADSVADDAPSAEAEAPDAAPEAPMLRAPVLRAVQNNVITKIEAQTYNGSGPQGDTGQWDVFRLNAEFALPNGQVNAGDTTVITLPEKLKFNQTSSFEIKDSAGHVVANAVINGGAKTVTLTYTDYVENNSDITGSFYFYVQIDRDNVDEEENIPIEVDVSGKTIVGNTIHFLGIGDPTGHYLSKSGWQATAVGPRAIRYQLSVNTKGEAIQNVTITDKIASTGFTILPDSIVIMKGTWKAVHGDWELQNQTDVTSQYNVTWNADGSFTLDLGNISATDGFAIRYTAEASYDLVDGEIIKNDAVIRGTNIGSHTASANAYYYVAGGSAEGYVYTIRIEKVNPDGDALAGAVFKVIREANGQVVGTITTGADGTAEVTGLLKDSYRIEEVSAPDGYVLLDEPVVVEVGDFDSNKIAIKTITNEPATTSVSGSKTWDDADNQDGMRPTSITINLMADGEQVDSKTVTEADGWSWSFTGLPKYKDGAEIDYSITEKAVTGYTPEYDGYDVKNIHTPEVIDISGSKTWDDDGDQDGARPESVTIRLLADGEQIDSRTVTEADGWSWTFEGLPKFKDGREISYSITEDAVPGYSAEYSGYDVTNTHAPGKTSVTVAKAWDDADDQDGIRPESVTVRLLADGADTGQTAVLSGAANWTASFSDLDEYKDGRKVEYTVEELGVEGYTTTVSGDAGAGYTITNAHEPEAIGIAGSKTWDDAGNQDGARPESITIRLLADGAEVASRTVTEADGWSWTFEGLPKFRDGREISYSITEDAVPGYSAEYDGYDVVNTHAPGKTHVSVAKAWVDGDDRDGARPASVTVRLLADGVDTGRTLVLSAANGWTASFTDLDEYKDGRKVAYTVAEDAVEGYAASISGDASSGFTVTNTRAQTSPPPAAGVPKAGDAAYAPVPWLLALAGAALLLRARLRRSL